MNKEDFLSKVLSNLPIERKTEDFLKEVEDIYNDYLNGILDLEVDAFGGEELKSATIEDVKSRKDSIISALKMYFDGCHSEAYQLLKKQIVKSDGFLDIDVINKEEGSCYYRARKNNGMISSYKDMFHIPNDKRGIVKTARFSAPGYPCLYLGNTVYDCWEEMGRPSFEELYFSGFYVRKDFKVFDLRKPSKGDFEIENLPKTLKRLVYVIACQFKVLYQEQPFKPEYIIPQLILELIISLNRNKKVCEPNDLPWGVAYTSTHLSKDFKYREDYLENIAIPVIDSNFNNKHCRFLSSLFEISSPICYRYEELKERQFGIVLEPMGMDEKEKIAMEYRLTKLGFIEKRLKKNIDYFVLKPN